MDGSIAGPTSWCWRPFWAGGSGPCHRDRGHASDRPAEARRAPLIVEVGREIGQRFFATTVPPAAPAVTLVEVCKLYGPDFLIEAEAIAAL
jgi:hypothetical protein